MRTKCLKLIQTVFTVLIIWSVALPTYSAKDPGYITITGVVKDIKSKKTLEYVSISVPGTGIGTISNADGGFTIKVRDSLNVKTIEVSHIGYFNQRVPLSDQDMSNITIFLTRNENKLKEVVVESTDPLQLVEKAIDKIGDNNSLMTNLLTGFYRETIQKRRSYINISEAVIDIYKTPYTQSDAGDRYKC
jgi:hypothetical protein